MILYVHLDTYNQQGTTFSYSYNCTWKCVYLRHSSIGCGTRNSPPPQGFLGFFRIPTLLNMFIPREARFIIFLRAQRVDVSGLQTWIPNSLQNRWYFFADFPCVTRVCRSTLVSCFVRSKNAKNVYYFHELINLIFGQIFTSKRLLFFFFWYSTLRTLLSFCMKRHLHDGRESCHIV